ncbi:palmitoyltransferase ZDHHC3-like [Tubulanus polymorphus]|uniref:palmitoyltransferase ZDHHC3-like n=1 Tax=Tubulanus polymorphus TaxID=672921 RepID=UPI003DA434F0
MAVFRADACGITCMFITYLAVFYADYVVINHLVIPTLSSSLWGAVNALLFNVVLFLLAFSHLRAVLSDPGIVPLPDTGLDFSDARSGQKYIENKANEWTICMKCETYRPPRAHHCRTCRRCVRRMDHHCPWINNCVGEYNQKYFIQFLFYVGVAALYALILVIISWVSDPNSDSHKSKHLRIMHSVILVIECVMFELFVIAIGCDQMQAILGDETAVEHVQKKGPLRPKISKKLLLAEVFGKGPVYLWFCPLQFQPMNGGSSVIHPV